MKKIGLFILAGLFLFSIYSIIPDLIQTFRTYHRNVEADEVDWDEEENGGGGTTPTTPSNFSVLEIVPYAGLGEIGYLIGGEEPIDQSLMKISDTYDYWFTDNSIDKYISYEDEFMNPTGVFTKTGTTLRYQNGYFKQVRFGNDKAGNLYSLDTSGYIYIKVAQGTGNYKAVLNAPVAGAMTMYSSPSSGDILMNYRNVNAYFVKKPTTEALYSATKKYYVSCVTEVKDHTGDYDYDPATEVFKLNRGHGDYHVLFSDEVSKINGSGEYYMLKEYEVVTDNSGDYSWSITYEPVGTNMGNYKQIPHSFTYHQWYGGQYQWTSDNTGPADATLKSQYDTQGYCIENPGTADQKYWIKGQAVTVNYQYTYHIQLVNNEWFKRFTMGLSSDQARNCQVKVTTLTPTQLNQPENKHYIEEANFIYIKKTENYNYVKLYERLNSTAIIAESKTYQTSNFQENDLSWDNVITIFEKSIGLRGARPAIIIEDNVYTEAIGSYSKYKKSVTVSSGMWMNGTQDSTDSATGTTNNIAKLYLMLMQRDAKEFYDQFINPANPCPYKVIGVSELDSNLSATRSTGSFVRPDSGKSIKNADGTYNYSVYKTYDPALYWNEYTFLPFTIAMDGTITRYVYYTDTYNPYPTVRTSTIEDGTKLWKLREDVPLPAGVASNDTVIRYKIITDLKVYIKYWNFDEFGPNKLNDNVFIKGEWAIIAGSTLDDNPTFSDKNVEVYTDVNAHLIGTDQITTPKSSFTLAEIINVITNNGKGYANTGTDTTAEPIKTRVLNIEPTADYTASEATIRAMLSNYSVELVNMTSTEFNSYMTDINSRYDMIYIGTGAGRYNHVDSNTVFNNSALAQSVYNRGDTITTNDGSKSYIGNDFTAQKIDELSEFLAAGLPIVMDNAIYTNSVAVRSDTNLHNFIQTKAIPANTNLLNAAGYDPSTRTVFMGALTNAMNTERPKIKLLRPVTEETDIVKYVGADQLLDLAFVLMPNGLVADESKRYKSYLYLDLNEDGIFSESERLNPNTYGITESQYKIYLTSYNMSANNGIYQWKIKVVKQSIDAGGVLHDTSIRSEATGYAAVTHRKTINILHIIDNPDTDPNTYSLQEKATEPTSLFHTYGGFGTTPLDYNLSITTLTVDEFMGLYEAEPYVTANHVETNKLAGYHIVIFDNQNKVEPITDEHGALTNLRYEITDGMGVLFTRDAVSIDNQYNYLAAANGILENQSTYSRLNMIATNSNTYYNFNYAVNGYTGQLQNLNTYQTTFITRANAASISQYPYKMNGAVKISSSFYPWNSAVEYNRTSATPLTGWFCLSDSYSPEVQNVGLSSKTGTNIYTGIYSSSPNDVRNNYYLFNKGKIYFSGIQLKQADAPGFDDEIKLFVNTIIACYRTSGRIISIPPSIKIIEPTPIANTISLTPADVGTLPKFPITFTIERSSSEVGLSIKWNDNATPGGTWNTVVYKVESDGKETLINNLSRIPLGTYRFYIPVSTLEGSHQLSILAKNLEDKEYKLDTSISYVSQPVSIKLTNDELVKNVDKFEQYLYIDMDYAAADQTDVDTRESEYLKNMGDINLEFTVDNVATTTAVGLSLKDEHGNTVSIDDASNLKIYKVNSTDNYLLNTKTVPEGEYYIKLPSTIMKGVNSAELTLSAEVDSTNKGDTKVILLRRNLFPLD